MSAILGIFFGTLAVIVPFASLLAWMIVFNRYFVYSREGFKKTIFLKGWGKTARYTTLGAIPILITLSSFVSAGISVAFEVVFAIFIMLILPPPSVIPAIATAMSAGPIEESAKLLCSALLYFLIFMVWRSRKDMMKERNRIKDGMIIGLLAGASFGLLESMLYLFSGFILLLTKPIGVLVVDQILWRIIFGVSLHALWTGISSTGLGRSTWRDKFKYTLIFLSISIVFHALNNGIASFIQYGLEMENTTGLIIIDILQMILILIGFIIFILVWRRAGRSDPVQK